MHYCQQGAVKPNVYVVTCKKCTCSIPVGAQEFPRGNGSEGRSRMEARIPHPQGLVGPPGLRRPHHQRLPQRRPRRLPHPEIIGGPMSRSEARCGPPGFEEGVRCGSPCERRLRCRIGWRHSVGVLKGGLLHAARFRDSQREFANHEHFRSCARVSK
jgi:hypothetical protein